MDYDNFKNSKNLDWFDTGPWHKKNICSKLHGINIEDFITQARTDRYNIMCYLMIGCNKIKQTMKAVSAIE